MPPKVKVTRQQLLDTAVAIVRQHGAAALNARTLARALDCSTQPVFSNFSSMEELKLAVVKEADNLYQAYLQKELAAEEYPAYKATGMAYIRFAREEKELFKLLFMRDRSAEPPELDESSLQPIFALAQDCTGLDSNSVRLFHLEIWIFVHGIATMIATDYLTFDKDFISRLLTDTFQGLKKRFEV